ncbi:MAG TPA: SAF domain-containing protein [Jatrophihabitans sp.]|nr:SAF domain-containing protein [Jatrophihabitans sp.]
MTETSRALVEPSPLPQRLQRPSWLDLRLVAGVVLILASVVGGATIISAADHRQARWAVTRDLAAGTVLSAGDLRSVRVQLGGADNEYLPVTEAVVGRAIDQAMAAGMLLPRAALAAPPTGITVTIPLLPDNGPQISQGDRITVWLSTKTCQGEVLLSGVAVQDVTRSGDASFGSEGGSVLVVNVPAVDARRVVAALDLDGAVIRAGILGGGQQPDRVSQDLAACTPAGTAGSASAGSADGTR